MEHSRLHAVKALLQKKELSHILISDLIDIEYLTGFRSSNALLLVSNRNNLLFSDFRYKESAERFCSENPAWKFKLVKEQLYGSLCRHVIQGSRVGFQSDHLSVDTYNELRKNCKGSSFRSISPEISEIFVSKTPREIAAMKKAASIGDEAFQRLLGEIKAGMTEVQVARRLEALCSELGSQKQSFETIVLFGARAALPHGKPGKKKVTNGDWILVDFGCTYNGFCSDMTRTVVFGKAGTRQRSIYSIVKDAQEQARSAAKAGISAKALDAEARIIIEKAGYGKEFGHALGHGVGLRIHEKPRVSPHVSEAIPKNSVITIEPGIYIPRFGGVRIEDMIVLQKNGSGLLTHSSRELIEL